MQISQYLWEDNEAELLELTPHPFPGVGFSLLLYNQGRPLNTEWVLGEHAQRIWHQRETQECTLRLRKKLCLFTHETSGTQKRPQAVFITSLCIQIHNGKLQVPLIYQMSHNGPTGFPGSLRHSYWNINTREKHRTGERQGQRSGHLSRGAALIS